MGIKIEALRNIKLSEIRRNLSKECYQRSLFITFSYLIFDLAWYVASVAMIFESNHIVLQLLGCLSAGLATSALFIWGHDAAHGALFKNQYVAELLGTITMLPSFNIYRLWRHGHNRIHHGFTSLTTMDWIWRPWSPKEYFSKSAFRRWVYRCERALLTCAVHYFLRVWWEKMIRFKMPKKRVEFILTKSIMLTFIVVYTGLSYYFTRSLWVTLCVVVFPFIIFNYMIAFFVYLHHTHPSIPFFDKREQWSFGLGGIHCSTIIRTSRLWEFMTHNILIHTPHHVDFRVPFYRLKRAYKDLKEHYGDCITEYKFSWVKVIRIFRQCKLYDYESKMWCDFKGVPIQLN
ncbi:MAG TPA: fatty acid desaturase [Gammaproteobacteria bacterium]|nr:fatty acid desaturase [Gammaproteobacteria bacterium]